MTQEEFVRQVLSQPGHNSKDLRPLGAKRNVTENIFSVRHRRWAPSGKSCLLIG